MLVVHGHAEAELNSAADYYDGQQPGLGAEFRAAVETVYHELQENPHLGAAYRNSRFRFFPLQRFPYVVYYAELPPDILWVVAVAHGSRRPGYWRRRRFP